MVKLQDLGSPIQLLIHAPQLAVEALREFFKEYLTEINGIPKDCKQTYLTLSIK